MNYAYEDLLDDISLWMALGLVIAGIIAWAVPPQVLATYGSGLEASIPMYICATAATPIAVAMMIAGVSPGTALVFLLAGPDHQHGHARGSVAGRWAMKLSSATSSALSLRQS